MFKFDYEGWSFATNDSDKMDDFLDNWIKNHWEFFVEWSDYLVTEDNYEDYTEKFMEETVTEE